MKPLLMLLAGLVMLAGTPVLPVHAWRFPFSVPSLSPAVTAACYVYEKDAAPVPVGVSAGLDRLNRERKVLATLLEVDTVDGTGDVPEQYKSAVVAAKEATLPAFVVLSGSAVIRVVKSPTTAEQITGAVP